MQKVEACLLRTALFAMCSMLFVALGASASATEFSSITQIYPTFRQEVLPITTLSPDRPFTRNEIPVLGRNVVEFPDGSVAHIMPYNNVRMPHATPPIGADTTLPLLYHRNGAIQKAPKQVLMLWGFNCRGTTCSNDPDNTIPTLFYFLKGVGGSHYLNSTTQYYSTAQGRITNPRGTLISYLWDFNPAPLHPTQQQIAAQVKVAQQFLHLGNNKDINYIIALGYNHDPPGFGPGGYCAFHSAFGTVASFQPYTVEPYVSSQPDGCSGYTVNGPLDGVSVVLGHEVGETITDPGLNAWYSSSGEENGDKCANLGLNLNVNLLTGIFPVQPLWSNLGMYCAV
ncbi:MAG: hypothetical protein NVSMB64_26510 [Candidatus Velthaea sp.]